MSTSYTRCPKAIPQACVIFTLYQLHPLEVYPATLLSPLEHREQSIRDQKKTLLVVFNINEKNMCCKYYTPLLT
jgi:hypothetical protein